MTVFDHIERLRGKPHHVRKQIAYGGAFAISAVIGILWFGVSLASGSFALHPTSFAEATAGRATVAETGGGGEGVLAGAAASLSGAAPAPAIEVVDVAPAPAPAPEATVIPF